MKRFSGCSNDLPLWLVHGLMFFSSALVSTSFTVGEAIADGLDPALLTLVRFFLAALLFLPFVHFKHSVSLPSWNGLLRYSLISGALVVFFWLMFLSLRYTTALNTGVIFTLVPGISGLYSAILLRERLGFPRLTALILAMAGAIMVIFQGDMSRLLSLEFNYGDLLFFIGCLFMAFYTPLIKLLHRGEPMAVVTFWILVTGCVWLLIFSAPALGEVAWGEIRISIWLGIIYLAIFCTIITFFLTQVATLSIGPTRVMAYSYLYPPMVLAINRLFGHPLPPPITMIGVAIIIPALVVLQIGAGTEPGRIARAETGHEQVENDS